MTVRTVRTTVRDNTMEALRDLAEGEGVTLAAYVRNVLDEHIVAVRAEGGTTVAPVKTPLPITREQWLDFKGWVFAHPTVLTEYKGDRRWADPAARSAVIAWAAAHHDFEYMSQD